LNSAGAVVETKIASRSRSRKDSECSSARRGPTLPTIATVLSRRWIVMESSFVSVRVEWLPRCVGLLGFIPLPAPMLDKLLAKTLLRRRCALQRCQRDFEGSFAITADSNGWCGAQPFRHPKIHLCDAHQFPTSLPQFAISQHELTTVTERWSGSDGHE
jgi:hypothetical protein